MFWENIVRQMVSDAKEHQIVKSFNKKNFKKSQVGYYYFMS